MNLNNTIEKQYRYALYCRVSTDDQAERQTIENQIYFAERYCELHNITLVKTYKDDGVSGTIPIEQRPMGIELLSDAKDNKFDVILIYKIDRIGRIARVILNAIHELENYNIQVRSMTEPFDTGSSIGRFVVTMLAAFADLDRENILDKLWQGANRAARQGKWLGGIVPYGYFVNENGFLEVNYNQLENYPISEYEIIKMIFDKVGNEKWTLLKVANHLNNMKIPTSYAKNNRTIKHNGKRKIVNNIWTPTQIGRIIKNTTYYGVHYYGKNTNKTNRELIERQVPAIIDKDLYDKAQQTVKENKIYSKRNQSREYLLKGLIKCGCCGSNYSGKAYSSSKAFYYCYGKDRYRNKIENTVCKSKNIPAIELEEFVWNECLKIIDKPNELHDLSSNQLKYINEQKENIQKELNLYKNNLLKSEKEKQSILDLYRKQIITESDVQAQLLEIEQEKNKTEQIIKELVSKLEYENNIDNISSAKSLLVNLKEFTEKIDTNTKTKIIRLLVSSIVVNTAIKNNRPVANIEINFNIRGIEFIKRRNMESKYHKDVLVETFLIHKKNALAQKKRYMTICKKLQDQYWIGLICLLKQHQFLMMTLQKKI